MVQEKSGYVEGLNAPSGDDERSETSEQHMIESDHDDVAVHIVDETQSERERKEEEGNNDTIKEMFIILNLYLHIQSILRFIEESDGEK